MHCTFLRFTVRLVTTYRSRNVSLFFFLWRQLGANNALIRDSRVSHTTPSLCFYCQTHRQAKAVFFVCLFVCFFSFNLVQAMEVIRTRSVDVQLLKSTWSQPNHLMPQLQQQQAFPWAIPQVWSTFGFLAARELEQFARSHKFSKSEKSFEGAEKPRESRATQVKNKTNPEMSFCLTNLNFYTLVYFGRIAG